MKYQTKNWDSLTYQYGCQLKQRPFKFGMGDYIKIKTAFDKNTTLFSNLLISRHKQIANHLARIPKASLLSQKGIGIPSVYVKRLIMPSAAIQKAFFLIYQDRSDQKLIIDYLFFTI